MRKGHTGLSSLRRGLVLLAIVDRQLSRRRGLSVPRLAVEWECSTKTVHRHIWFIRDRMGVPVEYNARDYVWRYPRGGPRIFSEWVRDYAR